jgi:hypothetical protein
MTARQTFLASCAALLLAALSGCRSAATPTFATAQSLTLPESERRPPAMDSRPAPPMPPAGDIARPASVVLPVMEEAPSARESPFTRLLGKFGKPRPIPLPRTDLDAPAATQSEVVPAGELAEAF